MRRLHDSPVDADHLDTLGHMNFRFYVLHAHQANTALMESYGLRGQDLAARHAKLFARDTLSRFRREQFAGAHLTTYGGVTQVNEDGVSAYYEVRNEAQGAIAASVILTYALIDARTRAPLPLPADVAAAAARDLIVIPDHGLPRSLTLDPPRLDVTYRQIETRIGGRISPDTLNRPTERTVAPEEADEYGYLDDQRDVLFLPRRVDGETPIESSAGIPQYKTEEGRRFAWAWLETRNVRVVQPRVGDVLQSIGVDIGMQAKTRHSRRWAFNKQTGAIASVSDTIGIALDLEARRPVDIPAEIRAELVAAYTPEFA